MCTTLLCFHFCISYRVLTTKIYFPFITLQLIPLPCYPSRPNENKHGETEWLLLEGKGYFHLLMHFFRPLSFYPVTLTNHPHFSSISLSHTHNTRHTHMRAQRQSTTSGSGAQPLIRSESHPASSAL